MSLQMPLLVVVMVIAAAYSFSHKSSRSKKRCVVLISIILALFSGLRSWWMGDLIKYYTLYLRCSGPDWLTALTEDSANLGIRWFFHYANVLGISYDNCILLIAVFASATLGILVYRYSPSPYWSYLMYIAMGFYIFTYSGLKQTIAMGFVILAAMAMFEKKFWKFVFWVCFGSLFHAPALIFLAAYPFCRQRLNMRYLLVVACLAAAMFLFRAPIVNFMTSLYYDDKDAVMATTEVGGRFMMMGLIIVLGIVLRPLRQWDETYLQVFNLMIVAAALQTMSVYDNVFTRLTDYYYQFIVLFLPMMLQSGHSQARALPNHRYEVRYWPPEVYILLGLGITLFALWYYNGFVDSSWAILKDFFFRWEIDPYSLYGK